VEKNRKNTPGYKSKKNPGCPVIQTGTMLLLLALVSVALAHASEENFDG
jgi:hypothetical protein